MGSPTAAITELRGSKAHPSCQGTNKPSAGAIVGFLHLYRSTNYPLKARLSPSPQLNTSSWQAVKIRPDFAKVVLLMLYNSYRPVFLRLSADLNCVWRGDVANWLSNNNRLFMVAICFTFYTILEWKNILVFVCTFSNAGSLFVSRPRALLKRQICIHICECICLHNCGFWGLWWSKARNICVSWVFQLNAVVETWSELKFQTKNNLKHRKVMFY